MHTVKCTIVHLFGMLYYNSTVKIYYSIYFPFHWWSFRLFPDFHYYKQCYFEHSASRFLTTAFLHSLFPSRTLIRHMLDLLSLWSQLFSLQALFWPELAFGQCIHIITDFPVHYFFILLSLICFLESFDWIFHFNDWISFLEVILFTTQISLFFLTHTYKFLFYFLNM